MIRCGIRYALFLFLVSFIFLLLVLSNLDSTRSPSTANCPRCQCSAPQQVIQNDSGSGRGDAKWMSCNADGGKLMQCLYDGEDVYFPFQKFLKPRFDALGRFSLDSWNRTNRFEWMTSSSKMKYQDIDVNNYDFLSPYGQFAFYSVETRERVRCISAEHGVPMSTQWSPQPYFYPIQIAQFALQHYSRYKTGPLPSVLNIGVTVNEWRKEGDGSIKRMLDSRQNDHFLQIFSKGQSSGAILDLSSNISLMVVSFDWKPSDDASFVIAIQHLQTKAVVELRYVQIEDGRCVWADESSAQNIFYYSLGNWSPSLGWRTINRNVLTDFDRALVATSKIRKNSPLLHPGDVSVLWISFRGLSAVKNVQQRSSANLDNFLIAADWFVKNQDADGGWSVPVERSAANNRLYLPAGWHSAMAQGHGLSVLSRAYGLLNDTKYLQAAAKALALFEKPAASGGVTNDLFGHVWYEEYPTTPGTFVLNGFMYALIGLYDFSRLRTEFATKADDLFKEGVASLDLFLPLYDTGSGSIYDLRHLSLQAAPNLARWDYHSVHIYLLKWLYSLTKRKHFDEVANRWIGYSQGLRAKHN